MRRAAAVLLLLLGACARTAGPIEVPSDDLPFPLARGASVEATTDAQARTTIYLAKGKRLIAVTRTVPAGGSRPEATVRAMLEGPTTGEREDGIRSRVPATVQLLRLSVADGLASIDLSGEFQAPARPDLVLLRVGQVVWTLTRFPEVDAVQFFSDGEPVGVATDHDDVARIVRQSDYSSIAPA